MSSETSEDSSVGNKLSHDTSFAYHILVPVFKYLNLEELLEASKVCSMWQWLINDYLTFASHLTPIACCGEHLEELVIQHGSWIEYLQLLGNDLAVDDVLARLKELPKLRKIDLVYTSLELLARLPEVHRNFDFIRVISVNDSSSTVLIDPLFDKLPNLSDFRLEYGSLIYMSFEKFKNLNNLRHISLRGYGTRFNWESLPHLKKLDSLDISLSIHPEAKENFGSRILKHLKGLSKLGLEHVNNCGNETPVWAIKELPNLKELDINITIIEDFNHLESLYNLRKLTILSDKSCDAEYNSRLVECVIKLKYSLSYFTWVLPKEFSEGKSTFTFKKNDPNLVYESVTDLQLFKTELAKLLSPISRVNVLLGEEYYAKKRQVEKCFRCTSHYVPKEDKTCYYTCDDGFET